MGHAQLSIILALLSEEDLELALRKERARYADHDLDAYEREAAMRNMLAIFVEQEIRSAHL